MKHFALAAAVAAVAFALAGCENMPGQKPAQNAPATPTAPAASNQAPAAAATQAQAPRQQGAPVTILLAQKAKAPGMTELKLKDASLWYAPQPVLTRADMVRVTPMQTKEGAAAVVFNFSQEGAQKLAAATAAANKGKYLVIAVGNQLVAVPQISAPLTEGALGFGVPNTAQADAIVNAIRGGAQK